MTNAQDILVKGLLAGFAGTSTFGRAIRGEFTLTSSEVPFTEKGSLYIDQWIGKRSGGGQELAQCEDEQITRVYAGGTVSLEVLTALGIQDSDIMAYLKEKLMVLSGKTRLSTPVDPIVDGDWEYRYDVLYQMSEISLTIGKEIIMYKSTPVFIHIFLNSPVL